MGMAEDIAQIKWAIQQLGDAAGLSEAIKALEVESRDVLNKIRYDIEPKLDKALEGKTATDATQEQVSMDEKMRQIKLMLIYASDGRKIEAIKALRTATNAGLKEAKDTTEWIEARLRIIRQQAIDDYKDNNEKEAE